MNDEVVGDGWPADDAPEDLGKCCVCMKEGPDVRNLMMIERKAPPLTTGWGCLVCALPTIGAVAVLCDTCLEADLAPKFVVSGTIKGKGRQHVMQYPFTPFGHDLSKHPELHDDNRVN